MSKASRRQQRSGSPTQAPQPGAAAPDRPTSHSPTGTPRAGRREHPRHRSGADPSFVERYRPAIVVVVVVAAIALIGGFVYTSATKAAYSCTTIFTPEATASPAAGSTNPPGYVQPDMGRRHVPYGTVVTYQYCAPASGSHDNQANTGPIGPRLYGPDDAVIPQGWIHNLEHGALVVLYTGSSAGATPEGQRQLQAFYDTFPNSPVCNIQKGTTQGPVIARMDQMATDYTAIVWGRVLPLDTWDPNAILDFYAAWGEKTNPEQQCAPPTSPSPVPSASSSPSASAPPSAEPSAAPSIEPSASPS